MSWLGDQFNSITGKINDFTEVLNGITSDLSSDVPNENGITNPQELINLCKEKDQKIRILTQEKESLESSIEELDQQHQEAINALLQSKNTTLAENRELKAKLAELESKSAGNATRQNFPTCETSLLSQDLQKLLKDTMGISSVGLRSDCNEENINVIMLLHLLSHDCTEEKLNNKIDYLEKQKHSLVNDTCEEDKDTVNSLINKINNYEKFLKTVGSSSESVFPVISEICSAFNLLVLEIGQLNQRLESVQSDEVSLKELSANTFSDSDNVHNLKFGQLNEFSEHISKIKICDSCIQTDNLTEVIKKKDKNIQNDLNFFSSSKQSQTESTEKVDENVNFKEDKLINELQSSILLLEQEKAKFQDEICNLKSLLNKSSESVLLQTDENATCKCEELKSKLSASEKSIFDMESSILLLEQEKTKYQNEISNLNCILNKSYSSVLLQTDEVDVCDCEPLKSELSACKKSVEDMEYECNILQKEHLDNLNDLKEKLLSRESMVSEKDSIIKSQKKEVLYLKDKIKNLISNMNSLQNGKDPIQEMPQQASNGIPYSYNNKQIEDSLNELTHLKSKVTNLELEKGKLLCVLNEKSQECSSLKSEVHKLTNIVASEKQALFKLQQDNCELKLSNKESSDPELTKDTIKKLSTMIRDKDFEIESLKQKNSTLTTLLQDATNIPEHLQSLVEEKENLSKEINLYKTDREKYMVSYNTKDKECRKYASEVKELSSALSEQRARFDVLEQKHLAIAQQYEEKQKSLVNTQNEMVVLKQRVTDLEDQQIHLKEQYNDLLSKINSETTIQITREELDEKDERLERLTCSVDEKDRLIREKDVMIHDLSMKVKGMKSEMEERERILASLEKKVTDSMEKIADLKNTIEQLESEKLANDLKLQDKISESTLLRDMNERLNMALKEKEFAMQSMTEKVSSLSQYINSDHSSDSGAVDINQILADSESMFSKAQSLYRERDETLLSLNQSRQENQNLRNEIQRMKSNEIHLKNELERLRQHLIEIEEAYTNEALKSEEKAKQLQDELVEVRRRAEITSTAVVDTSQRASVQIASLQEQLSMIANQRDEALSQISSLEDEVQHHSTAVSKLQLVLEQMQKGNERKIKDVENKWQVLLEKEKLVCKQFADKLEAKQRQLEESAQALEAASRLSEQLDAKEEVIAHLRDELSKTENKIKSTAKEIDSIRSNTEGKVDRLVMKSLVLGYFSTPSGQKSEVIRLLARVLDFNQEEMERAGIVVGRHDKAQVPRGIFSSIFNRLPSLGSPEKVAVQPEKSFTTLFVQFLENESQPVVPMPFPVDRMTQEQLKANPRKSHQPLPGGSGSPHRRSPLLLEIDSAFPTFTPVPAVEYSASPAPAILKEVLE